VTDAEAIWPYVSDPEIPRFMTWDAHLDIAETREWLSHTVQARAAMTDLVWAMIPDGEGPPVGVIGLHEITRKMRAWRMERAELGYWIAPAFQNRGLVTEAARTLLRFAFTKLALHKVTVGCITDNTGSRRVIEKLGFRLIGEQHDHMFRFERW